jgi:hypothetical protein
MKQEKFANNMDKKGTIKVNRFLIKRQDHVGCEEHKKNAYKAFKGLCIDDEYFQQFHLLDVLLFYPCHLQMKLNLSYLSLSSLL